MSTDYLQIIDDPGFQAIARAVRRATVQAQFLKANGARGVREIRYDLLPELRRAKSLTDPKSTQLVDAISDFVSKYNVENARRREENARRRESRREPLYVDGDVSTEAFRRLVALIQEHGAGVVGALLCAYGTCVEPREVGDAAVGGVVEEPEASPSENVENLTSDTVESEG